MSKNIIAAEPRLDIVRNGLTLWLDASLQSSYPGSGSTWFDLSGNDQNFTLYNSPTYSTNNGGELLFSGTNDYARIINSTAIDSSASSGTIDFWFRSIYSSLGPHGGRLISFSDSSGTGSDTTSTQGSNKDYNNYLCIVKNNPAESISLWYKANPSTFGPSTLVNTNSYFNAAITWDTSGGSMTFKFYLNSTNSNTTTVTQSPYGSAASTITIGQNCAGALSNPFENTSCAFSNIKLYSRALTSAEISHNYNVTKSRFGL